MITLAALFLTATQTANADLTTIKNRWSTLGTGSELNLYDVDTSHKSILNELYNNQVKSLFFPDDTMVFFQSHYLGSLYSLRVSS